MRGYVDANVILRFITGDPPEMAAHSAALFRSVENGDTVLLVDEIVIAEVVWVLESFYHYKASDIAPVVREFLLQEGVEAEGKAIILEALSLYETRSVDFADALIAAQMHKRGIEHIFSFDAHFDRIPGVRRIVPGSSDCGE